MKRVLNFVAAGIILVCAILGFFVAPQSFPVKDIYAQTNCATPAQVAGVTITFPYCTASGSCQFTQASCTWTAQADAVNYQVVVRNVTTNTQVASQQIASGTTLFVFPVQDKNTYECSVSAVNSCGASGPAGVQSLLCEVDGLVNTPTPAPTTPPVAPQPTVPPSGMFENTIMLGLGVAIFVAGGLVLILL